MEAARIDATCVQQFNRKTVKIIGLLKQYDQANSTGEFEANGTLHLQFQSTSTPLEEGRWYEVVALVDNGGETLQVLEYVDMGTDMNAKALNKMVEMVQQHHELFYE